MKLSKAIDIFFKCAQVIDEEVCSLLSSYVATLRALYLLHQNHHWEAEDYQHHLLFQRLYDSVQASADAAAERVVGLCGKLNDVDMYKLVESFEGDEFVESSLAAEEEFQKLAKTIYAKIKEKNVLTLGLDDLIMSQASDGEERIYLLKQSLPKKQ